MTMQTQEQRDALRQQLLGMGFLCKTPTYNDHKETWERDGAILNLQWTYPLPGDPKGPQKPSGAPMRYFLQDESNGGTIMEVGGEYAKSLESNGFAHVIQGGSGVVPEYCRQPGETEEQYLAPWLVMAYGPAPIVGRD